MLRRSQSERLATARARIYFARSNGGLGMLSYATFRADKLNKHARVLAPPGSKFEKIGENFVDSSVNKKDYELELETGPTGLICLFRVRQDKMRERRATDHARFPPHFPVLSHPAPRPDTRCGRPRCLVNKQVVGSKTSLLVNQNNIWIGLTIRQNILYKDKKHLRSFTDS